MKGPYRVIQHLSASGACGHAVMDGDGRSIQRPGQPFALDEAHQLAAALELATNHDGEGLYDRARQISVNLAGMDCEVSRIDNLGRKQEAVNLNEINKLINDLVSRNLALSTHVNQLKDEAASLSEQAQSRVHRSPDVHVVSHPISEDLTDVIMRTLARKAVMAPEWLTFPADPEGTEDCYSALRTILERADDYLDGAAPGELYETSLTTDAGDHIKVKILLGKGA